MQGLWREYTRGYDVPLVRTTLRGVRVHAAIAGKALGGKPAKPRDAIWHFVCKIRGNSTEPKFRTDQVQLAVVISNDDFRGAEEKRAEFQLRDADNFTGRLVSGP